MAGKRYDNYLFDLYGTLVDIHTDEDREGLWVGMSRLLGMKGARWEPEELHRRYLDGVRDMEVRARAAMPEGEPEIDLAPVFKCFFAERGQPASIPRIAETAMAFRTLSLEKLRLFDGAAELLERLHAAGRRVFLLSNAQSLFTRPELELLGLSRSFDGILLSSEAGRKKPDPAFFAMLLEQYHLEPARTVMVGNDDAADCRGAAAAGLDSMYIRTAQSPEPSGPLPKRCRGIKQIADVFK